MLKRCVKCLLPETYETIEFDEAGVCNMCRQKEFRDEAIDWEARGRELAELIAQYRGKYDYDCLIPFSGGKDSTYTLYYLVKHFNIKPLVMQFNHGFFRENLKENNERTFKKLGVDVITFTPNWKVVKRLMLEALIRKGILLALPHRHFCLSDAFGDKIQCTIDFLGEPSSEYTNYYDYRDNEVEEVDEVRFNRFVNLGITAEDMTGMIAGDFALDPRDLIPYTYPPLRDLKRLGYRSVCLGSYIPWDAKENAAIIGRELGWQGAEVEGMPSGLYPHEKIECSMQGVRDYIKFLKRGYSRVSQMVALDIRNGRMTTAEGQGIIDEYDGRKPPSLELFLEYLSMSEQEFNEIVKKTVVSPYCPDFANIPLAPKTADFSRWYRESNGS